MSAFAQLLPEAITPLFRHRGEDWRQVWDYEFKWTADHRSAEEMRPMMFTYDTLADEALDRLDEISPPPSSKSPPSVESEKGEEDNNSNNNNDNSQTDEKKPPRRDLYALLRDHADKDDVLGRLWEQANQVPDWVDWAQIERGQKVFLRYAGPSIFALTFQSLVGGMGSRRVVETLARTGGFSVKVTRRRLLETFQHILQSTQSLASIQPGGDGHASTLRVRLLHAAVRRRITALAAQRPGYYDTSANGIPVNDLDSAGTISTFSATLLWIGLPRQGIFLTKREKEDYVALWRYIAHVIGAPTDMFASTRLAKATMESLLLSEIDPSDTSRALANNVLTGMSDQPPSHVSRPFLAAEAYWLNGSTLARALAIQKPPFYYKLLVLGQCVFFAFMCYSHRWIPSWDEGRIDRLRKALYNLTVHKTELGALGRETSFEFQYVPTLETMATQMGTAQEAVRWGDPNRRGGGYERRNLGSLVIAAVVLGVGSWVGMKGMSEILGRVLG